MLQHDDAVAEHQKKTGLDMVNIKSALPATEIDSNKDKKKDKKKKNLPAAEAPSEPIPSMIDLRVGHIIKAIKHQDADSLYVSTIDVGEAEPRTVVSGLVKYIPLEEMQNRKVVCVCNLKPVAMRGVKSFAMVLAASPAEGDKDKVELVAPPVDAAVGERLSFAGFEEGEPLSQLNPKKKIWETIQPGFTTDDGLKVGWKDPKGSLHILQNNSGAPCIVESLKGAAVR